MARRARPVNWVGMDRSAVGAGLTTASGPRGETALMGPREPAQTPPPPPPRGGGGLRFFFVENNPLHAEGGAEPGERTGNECPPPQGERGGARRIDTEDFDVILTDL